MPRDSVSTNQEAQFTFVDAAAAAASNFKSYRIRMCALRRCKSMPPYYVMQETNVFGMPSQPICLPAQMLVTNRKAPLNSWFVSGHSLNRTQVNHLNHNPELVSDVAVSTTVCQAVLFWARRWAVARPRLSGRRSFLIVRNQVCLGRPGLLLQCLGRPVVLAYSAREWSWLGSALQMWCKEAKASLYPPRKLILYNKPTLDRWRNQHSNHGHSAVQPHTVTIRLQR